MVGIIGDVGKSIGVQSDIKWVIQAGLDRWTTVSGIAGSARSRKRRNNPICPHATNPVIKPLMAPERVPPFQNMPPINAGANCATAAKDIRPMETRA